MPTYPEALAALSAFRYDLLRREQVEMPGEPELYAFTARGAFAASPSPFSNIHATGVGLRRRDGEYEPGETVLKVFVFDEQSAQVAAHTLLSEWQGIPVDSEPLPIQAIRGLGPPPGNVPPYRQRQRPIVGGLSISPLNAQYVGTLGCFLRRRRREAEDIFALSNNHVLADVDQLPRGTQIAQPGPEQTSVTPPADVFASLTTAIPIRFPASGDLSVVNRFDAAIALVTDVASIQTGAMFGLVPYDPSQILPPMPGMRVMKVGRTTGVTHGLITATDVDGVQINYGSQQAPRLTTFDGMVEVVGTDGGPFSLPGDSGSVILEVETGHPVALLFAGDGVHTTACDFGALCRRLRAWPV